MRYYPAALALSLALAVTASMGSAKSAASLDPRAEALLTQGRALLAQGETAAATDAFEAALAVDPGYTGTYIALAEAARKDGLQGKAIHYYRVALLAEPNNLLAIAGEGGALVEKGAVAKARGNLTRLEGLCGKRCPATQELASAIARGPQTPVLTAEAVKPEPVVETN